MGRKKAVKELTEKEWLEREKECGLNEIKDKLNFINPPTYEFNIGDKVKFGNLKDATVDYISKDKKVYGLVCTRVNINHGNPYEDKTYMVVAWNEIRPLSILNNVSNFTKNTNININFQNTTIESLIFEYYNFGINLDPEYQRGYVWDDKDRENLIDSIFNNIKIGEFALNHLSDKEWEEKGFSYEIVDGKQRLSTLIAFYENRFPYKGYYFNDLSSADRYTFLNKNISVGKTRNLEKKDVLEYFLVLNRAGRCMDEEHLAKVEDMLHDELEKDNIERV